MGWGGKAEGRIFISYRRVDAPGVAGRLSDTLSDYFGPERVFRDIENIEGGADFGQVIEGNLSSADAMIVLIGPEWLEATDESGNRRLDRIDDWVAAEVGAALESGGPVFPVLIEGTPMPDADNLPQRRINQRQDVEDRCQPARQDRRHRYSRLGRRATSQPNACADRTDASGRRPLHDDKRCVQFARCPRVCESAGIR